METKEQQGGGFIGALVNEQLTETLIGVIAEDGKTLHFVNEDSLLTGTLRSGTEMAFYMQETGPAMVASCYVLTW